MSAVHTKLIFSSVCIPRHTHTLNSAGMRIVFMDIYMNLFLGVLYSTLCRTLIAYFAGVGIHKLCLTFYGKVKWLGVILRYLLHYFLKPCYSGFCYYYWGYFLGVLFVV